MLLRSRLAIGLFRPRLTSLSAPFRFIKIPASGRLSSRKRVPLGSNQNRGQNEEASGNQSAIDAIPVGPNKFSDSVSQFLQRPALVIGRQIEMLNIFLGYEQANRYVIYDAENAYPVGYILEEGQGIGTSLMRQFFGTHRPFSATIMTLDGNILLKLKRPYQFINSRLFVMNEHEEVIGEVQQRWHLWRRRYDLFVDKRQFAAIDAPWLSWDFIMNDEEGRALACVNKNFVGFGREIFTDTSQYIIRMGNIASSMISSSGVPLIEDSLKKLTVDERAVALAAAISIDFDYFSRHSGHGGIPLLYLFPFGGWGGGD